MNWTSLGHILTAVLAVTTVIATGVLGLMIGSLRTLRDSNTDLRARVSDLEEARSETNERLAKKGGEISRLTEENATLKEMVTGRVNWTVLNDQLAHHHEAAEEHWRRVEHLLNSRGTA